MNCFQNCIFAAGITTSWPTRIAAHRLWIAFKIVSLPRESQHYLIMILLRLSCELLSKLYLCRGNHNYNPIPYTGAKLWIAFKIVSLPRESQQTNWSTIWRLCCELLSKLYLCRGNHNISSWRNNLRFVVNCFQNCIFAAGITTQPGISNIVFRCELLSKLYLCRGNHNLAVVATGGNMLWIAFKIVSLPRESQPYTNKHRQC